MLYLLVMTEILKILDTRSIVVITVGELRLEVIVGREVKILG